MKDKKKYLFDYCIGNPPYNADFNESGQNGNYAQPVYNDFMDAANEVAEKVELIHPARFLFNAGSTPKAWNEKMLNDEHFKILNYEENSAAYFPSLATPIKGGIAISYYDNVDKFKAIGIFTPFNELNGILQKTIAYSNAASVAKIGVSGYAYHFTEKMHLDHPEAKAYQSKGHEYDLKSNIIEKLPMIFSDKKADNTKDYATVVGRENNERVTKYIERDYLNDVVNFDKYKLLIPKASGAGNFGEALGPSIIGEPHVAHTETFFSIGLFETELEAKNLYKYLKCC